MLKQQLEFLDEVYDKFTNRLSYQDRLTLALQYPAVEQFFKDRHKLHAAILDLPIEKQYVASIAVLIGQGEVIFHGYDKVENLHEELSSLLGELWQVESFYKKLGGLIGYQRMVVKLLSEQEKSSPGNGQKVFFEAPHTINLTENTREIRRAVIEALRSHEEIADGYPIGGAGDRLGLQDEHGNGLPAARLKFLGRTLLEGMIRDLAAREFLVFQLFGKQVETPLLLMTSKEKDNHRYIRTICNQHEWFGRKKELFFFVVQPLVPACTKEGQWVSPMPLKLIAKPGGHGNLLPLAKIKGAYDWIEVHKRNAIFFRQVNNPIGALDYASLAFMGIGKLHNKDFGFASCHRKKGTKEGINVVKKIVDGKRTKMALSNVEYCDVKSEELEKMEDQEFPANTNILFMRLSALKKAIEKEPFPGLLLNSKPVEIKSPDGEFKQVMVARLESTMQNIADSFEDFDERPLDEKSQEELKAYITVGSRLKTISAIKKSYKGDSDLIETPESCYIDMLKNARDLLVNYCDFTVPEMPTEKAFLEKGPSFLFFYHPALGPLYDIIKQKMQHGVLHPWAELNLEIADIVINHLDIDGSVTITTPNVMGHFDKNGHLSYSHRTGKCTLKNVRVKNRGLVREIRPKFWKNRWKRQEKLLIEIEENGEFIAEDVTFSGDVHIQVPKDTCCRAAMGANGSVTLSQESITKSRPLYQYSIDSDYHIQLDHS